MSNEQLVVDYIFPTFCNCFEDLSIIENFTYIEINLCIFSGQFRMFF